MRRRQFIAVLGGAVSTGAWAQASPPPRRIAFVLSTTPLHRVNEEQHPIFREFVRELRRLGYVEPTSLTLNRYSAEGRPERYAEVVQQVLRDKPDVIVPLTAGVTRAFREAQSSVPVVFFAADPVGERVVSSLARPDGNLTGISTDASAETVGKTLQLLKELAPRATHVGLYAPQRYWEHYHALARDAAARLRIDMSGPPLVSPADEHEYRRVMAAMVANGVDALFVGDSGENYEYRALIAALAEANNLPSISNQSEYSKVGGLAAYSSSFDEQVRVLARYVDRILKGSAASSLPVFQPTELHLTINLSTAARLRLEVPQTLLASADDLIR